jgi:hypothetical protein
VHGGKQKNNTVDSIPTWSYTVVITHSEYVCLTSLSGQEAVLSSCMVVPAIFEHIALYK